MHNKQHLHHELLLYQAVAYRVLNSDEVVLGKDLAYDTVGRKLDY